jgi:hypothetical protein
MRRHGKGPKDVLVPRYRRWVRGKLQGVSQALRGASRKGTLRRSRDQMSFAFERRES